MNESWFWGRMKDKLPLDFMMRVENKLVLGTPDVHYMHNAIAGWIELKYEEKLPFKIDFEPAQPLWLDNYWRKGGECYVALYVKDRQSVIIWRGSQAMDLGKKGGPQFIPPLLQVKDNDAGWIKLYNELFKRIWKGRDNEASNQEHT